MRILQISSKVPFPPKDGGAIAIFNIAEGFHSLGHEAHILCTNTPKHYTNLHSIPSEVKTKINIHAAWVNTDIQVLKALKNFLFSSNPYIAERFLSSDFEDTLIHLIQTHQYDVIQIEGLYLCIYIPIIRKYTKALIALRSHNIEHEIWKQIYTNEQNFLKKIYLKNLVTRIRKFKLKTINSYDVLIPITSKDATTYKALGNTKPMHILPIGIIQNNTHTIPKTKKLENIFFLGALDWLPNQEGLIWFIKNCYPEIHNKYPQLNFSIAGRNAPLALRNLILNEGIHFYGEIKDAQEFMLENGAMIVPLFSGSGMRVKIIEGMFHGKVIISTTLGAEGINCNNMNNILLADSKDQFIEAIEKIYTNHDLYTSIGQKAYTFAQENYENNKITSTLLNFYEKQIPK